MMWLIASQLPSVITSLPSCPWWTVSCYLQSRPSSDRRILPLAIRSCFQADGGTELGVLIELHLLVSMPSGT